MRSFIAIDFSEGVKARLIALQQRLQARVPGLKWSSPAQMHLTLKFLGEVDEAMTPTIGAATEAVARGHSPFDLTIRGAGWFGPRDLVHAVWAGIKDTGRSLYSIQSELEASMTPLGFPPEDRPFKPHLTLARNKNPKQSQPLRRAIEAESAFEGGVEQVDSLTLYQSVLGRDGPTYTVLSRHPLEGKPSPG